MNVPPAPAHPRSPWSVIAAAAAYSRAVALLLFLAALLPRLPGLDLFLTSDENTNIFLAGSDVVAAFLRGDLAGTYWHFYPGVTMSWLDGLGMAGQYLLAALSGAALPPFTDYIYSPILDLVVANRLPYALLTAAAVPAVYLLARQILPSGVALLGALLLAFDPFYLAHSRVAHGDAPVAVFMALSALALFVFLKPGAGVRGRGSGAGGQGPGAREWGPWAYLVLSAVCGGLAALTKAPGQFMALFVVGLAVLYAVQELVLFSSPPLGGTEGGQNPGDQLSRLRAIFPWLAVVATWGLVSLVTFGLLWPAMWIAPLATLGRMLAETFTKVDAGHLVYFFGRPTLDPGPWFYPVVIPFRLTPITLIGVFLSLLWLFFHRPAEGRRWAGFGQQNPAWLLWLFVLSLLLFGNISPKKQDRYLLPLFPVLDLLAAVGWLGLLDLLRPSAGRFRPVMAAGLLLLHLLPAFSYYPYYLAYFNPLLGGPGRAAETTLMGWGEGMEQAAAYLNTKPNAAGLYVASTPSQTLLPYFAGTGENFYTNDIAFRADYVVLYLAQVQRLAPSPEIVRYFLAQEPEKIITIQGVPYARIYPGPKLILADIPAGASPANVGLEDRLRLAGYELAAGRPGRVTLYWHALAPLPADYTISIRARTAAGDRLAQADSPPAGGLLPTSLWRQGDYVADTHTLDLTASAPIHDIEIVVYNAATGATLGPPLVLPWPTPGGGRP